MKEPIYIMFEYDKKDLPLKVANLFTKKDLPLDVINLLTSEAANVEEVKKLREEIKKSTEERAAVIAPFGRSMLHAHRQLPFYKAALIALSAMLLLQAVL